MDKYCDVLLLHIEKYTLNNINNVTFNCIDTKL